MTPEDYIKQEISKGFENYENLENVLKIFVGRYWRNQFNRPSDIIFEARQTIKKSIERKQKYGVRQ